MSNSLLNRKPGLSYLKTQLSEFNSKSVMPKTAELEIKPDPTETKTGLEDQKPEDNKTVEVTSESTRDATGEKLGDILEQIMDLEDKASVPEVKTTVSNESDKMNASDVPASTETKEAEKEDEPEEELKPADDDMDKEAACGKSTKKAGIDEATTDIITLIYHGCVQNKKYARIAEDAAVITRLLMINKNQEN